MSLAFGCGAPKRICNLLGGARDGSIISWHQLAHGLGIPFPDLAHHLDDPAS
jgi:hypothetical protein